MWDELKNGFKNTKVVITTISLMFTSVIGTYTVMSEFFVTRAVADQMVNEVKKEYNLKLEELTKQTSELKKQTKTNSNTLIEMQMIRIENKMINGQTLSPTEKRIYEKLKKQYEEIEF
jgi:hypothetical protein